MSAPTDWASAVGILAFGLGLGILFVVWFGRRKSAAKLADDPALAVRDLEAKRDALLGQLRDLDDGADPGERRRLELETADVLRALDARAAGEPLAVPPAATAPAAAPAAAAPSSALKGFLWGAASIAALAALGYFVVVSATDRSAGGSLTGGSLAPSQPGEASPPGPPPPDPQLAQLEAAVAADPDNLALRDDLAQAYLERNDLMAVFDHARYVLERSPRDSRALTFQAIVRTAMGERPAARQLLEQATASDPENLDAWVAHAWLDLLDGDLPAAEAKIAEAIQHSPADEARLRDVLAEMQRQAEQARSQAEALAEGGELPAGHPPIDEASPAPLAVPSAPAAAAVSPASEPETSAPAPPAEPTPVKVTLELAPGAATTSGILYVMARNPAGGPPIAVKRLPVSAFPVTVELGAADSMMGQEIPGSFRLEARLDSDGDVTTKPPTDPAAAADGVSPGAVLRLTLQ